MVKYISYSTFRKISLAILIVLLSLGVYRYLNYLNNSKLVYVKKENITERKGSISGLKKRYIKLFISEAYDINTGAKIENEDKKYVPQDYYWESVFRLFRKNDLKESTNSDSDFIYLYLYLSEDGFFSNSKAFAITLHNPPSPINFQIDLIQSTLHYVAIFIGAFALLYLYIRKHFYPEYSVNKNQKIPQIYKYASIVAICIIVFFL